MLIEFGYILRKYRIKPKGIIHIGANTGQEVPTYHTHGITKMVLIEAIPFVFSQLKVNTARIIGATCINACISDKDGEYVNFHVASNEGQSSSILEFGTHTQEHPSVTFVRDIRLKTSRMDSLIRREFIDIQDYNFLVMDIQGAELMALKSFGHLLEHFKYIYLEVNEKELYKDCALIQDIDEFLNNYSRVETKMTNSGWGDALYIKK